MARVGIQITVEIIQAYTEHARLLQVARHETFAEMLVTMSTQSAEWGYGRSQQVAAICLQTHNTLPYQQPHRNGTGAPARWCTTTACSSANSGLANISKTQASLRKVYTLAPLQNILVQRQSFSHPTQLCNCLSREKKEGTW